MNGNVQSVMCQNFVLLSSCNDSHLCSVLLSLCGMSSTCTTISDTIGSVEGSVAWLRDWSSSVFLSSMLSILASITGGKNDCKETSDNIFSFITNVITIKAH